MRKVTLIKAMLRFSTLCKTPVKVGVDRYNEKGDNMM